jgi:hypothetical protein
MFIRLVSARNPGNIGFRQGSRHGPCSILPGMGIGPRREGLARWNALGAARRLFRNGASAPLTAEHKARSLSRRSAGTGRESLVRLIQADGRLDRISSGAPPCQLRISSASPKGGFHTPMHPWCMATAIRNAEVKPNVDHLRVPPVRSMGGAAIRVFRTNDLCGPSTSHPHRAGRRAVTTSEKQSDNVFGLVPPYSGFW